MVAQVDASVVVVMVAQVDASVVVVMETQVDASVVMVAQVMLVLSTTPQRTFLYQYIWKHSDPHIYRLRVVKFPAGGLFTF